MTIINDWIVSVYITAAKPPIIMKIITNNKPNEVSSNVKVPVIVHKAVIIKTNNTE